MVVQVFVSPKFESSDQFLSRNWSQLYHAPLDRNFRTWIEQSMNAIWGYHSQSTIHPFLAYGWRAWNLNWPIRIQQAEKTLLSWHQCKLTGIGLESANFFTGDGIKYSRKGIYNSKNNIRLSKVKNTKQIPCPSFQFDAKSGSPASGMATCPWVVECHQIG